MEYPGITTLLNVRCGILLFSVRFQAHSRAEGQLTTSDSLVLHRLAGFRGNRLWAFCSPAASMWTNTKNAIDRTLQSPSISIMVTLINEFPQSAGLRVHIDRPHDHHRHRVKP